MISIASEKLYPLLPLRDIVIFPHMVVPLFVGRERSVRALENVMKEDKKVFIVSQKNQSDDNPAPSDIYSIGTIGTVLQLLKLPDGTVKVLVEGGPRARILQFAENDAFYQVFVEEIADKVTHTQELEALTRAVLSQFDQYVKLNKKIPPEVISSVGQLEDGSRVADTVASHLTLKLSEKQKILEIQDVEARLEKVYAQMEGEIGVLHVEKRIRNRVKKQMEKTQREYYLNEQMRAIQRELGEGEDGRDEISEIEDRIASTKLSAEAKEKAFAEVKKLRSMSSMSAEASVIRNYLDWLVSIPWKKRTKIKCDLVHAKRILDADHYGLEKVKERILEHLAVQNRVGKLKGPIMCLVGPPGVGKTSLGKSIAKATGRNFVRLSLGGVRDEAEIRGHRRTYVGSMPGKIIQGMKKGKASNPLFLLDEIDKLGSDWRGDPSSSLLEILDPEQNAAFNDHYLEVDYDLSDVMFVTTANSLQMPQPLLDRMEVIRISGYTEEEKLQIAKQHLIPKQRESHGLQATEWQIQDDAIYMLIRNYTREAGVRSLERELANVARKVVKQLASGEALSLEITADNLQKFSGIPRYHHSEANDANEVGVSTGLAWTEVGGEILMIEVAVLPGKGKVLITGKLGEVMQESVQAAISFIRAHARPFGVAMGVFEKHDIHVHVPEGATPKDGPSAGIAICTAVVSALTQIPVRRDTAMTGEITLRGRVLMIGGLKEKFLAAHRAGIKRVMIPHENQKDLEEVPEEIRSTMEIIPVATAEEALTHALIGALNPLPPEDETVFSLPKEVVEQEVSHFARA